MPAKLHTASVRQKRARRFLRAALAPGIEVAALSLPRGNGKTTLLAHLAARAITPGDPLFVAGASNVLRIAAYGLVQRHHPERLSYVYDLHIKNVCAYFRDRPSDFLIMNILEGDGWDVLRPFLEKPVPESPFPNLGGKRRT